MLITINRRFALLSTRIGVLDRRLAAAAVAADWPQTWNATSANVGDAEARAEWRAEVTAYADELGVKIPKWMKIIGTPRTAQ